MPIRHLPHTRFARANRRRVPSYPSVLNDGNTVAWYDYLENVTKDGSDLALIWGDKGGAVSADLVLNGSFTTDTAWDKAGTAAIPTPVATLTGDGTTGNFLTQLISGFSPGDEVILSYEVIANTLVGGSSPSRFFENYSNTNLLDDVGVHNYKITIGATGGLRFRLKADATSGTISIDNVFAKVVTGNNLYQLTPSKQPTVNSNGILLPGATESMKTSPFTLEQPEFIYMVLKQVGWTANDRIFDGNAQNLGAVYQTGTTPSFGVYAGGVMGSNANLTIGSYGILRVLLNGASSKSIVNETTPVTGDAGSDDMGGFTLGDNGGAGGQSSNIEVKEIIVRKSVVGEEDIYNYLKSKYGL